MCYINLFRFYSFLHTYEARDVVPEKLCFHDEKQCRMTPDKLDSPSMCLPSVVLIGDSGSVLPLVQVYVIGRIPIALQGRTTKVPIV